MRLAVLQSYGILDTPTEQEFDEICKFAAQLCGTPLAVINFLDAERQWFKSELGMGTRQHALDRAVCPHTVQQEALMVVPDLLLDPRFADKIPEGNGAPLRFYAGAVIRRREDVALGTVCVFDHPEAEAPESGRRHPQATTSHPNLQTQRLNLQGVKVLIVDDEADARALVKRLLDDRGAGVRAAGSVEDALRLLAEERPDVLVSDIGMPGEDGYALIRQVRALGADRGGAVPAVALTAYARAEDRMKAILAGFQMHVSKPVEPAELLTMVASLSGRAGSM